MRYRQVSLILGSLAALALTFFSDPDVGPKMGFSVGAQTFLLIKSIVMLSLAALVVHLGRKTLFDYLDLYEAIQQALKSPEGAGKAIQGIGLMLIAFAIVFAALVITT